MKQLLKKVKNDNLAKLRDFSSKLPIKGISNPVFIIGCGRSGTTIFGTILSHHEKVTYLNEPRNLWSCAYPKTDIWSSQSFVRQGKLSLTSADTTVEANQQISRLFYLATILQRKPVLIEKLPENAFRLDFISKIFPDARFIHIHRNGLEVARSIAKLSDQGLWFGVNNYKWNKLVEYALSKQEFQHLPKLCTTSIDKGLLEWRLSIKVIEDYLKDISCNKYIEINYDSLINYPQETISKVLNFVGLSNSEQINNFMENNLKRRSSKLGIENILEKHKVIGGDLLISSMQISRNSLKNI